MAFLLATAGRSEDVVRLRAVNARAAYRPGETIALEMECAPGMTDTAVIRLEAGALPAWEVGEVRNAIPKCPRGLFEVRVPQDFVGRAKVSALLDGRVAGTFSFNVKSDIAPTDLHITSSGAQIDPDECSTIGFDPDHPGRVLVQFVAEQPDGTIFDLCRGADIRVTTDRPEWFRFKADGHVCSITSRREGSFKLVASYGGLRKEFACRAQNFEAPSSVQPAASPVPLPKVLPPSAAPRAAAPRPRRPGDPPRISIPDFRHDPHKLDRHPMDVGQCRLLEHWTTGFCYVYSFRGSEKVSENADVPCDDLGELRKRMNRAIEKGHCD